MNWLHARSNAPARPGFSGWARVLVLLLLPASAAGYAQTSDWTCGNLYVNNFGPFDYRTEQGPNKRVVEDHHFTPKVERLMSGQSASLGADIDYTLRAFPNHHRALLAMMNLSKRSKTEQPEGAQYTVDCYFRRALTFRPDDQVARMLYAKHLAGASRQADALRQLGQVIESSKDNPLTQYNVGLLLFDMGEYERAATQVLTVEALGFDVAQLRERLRAKGKWPPTAAAVQPAEAASSAPRTP